MHKDPLVSILILTYDRTDLLNDCLRSVLNSDYPNLEFIVSDNGSSEDISGFIKDKFPHSKIKIVKLKVNRGLTGGFNFGFKFCKGKYIMLLSNDTKIEKRAISYMVNMIENDKKIGIVAPKIIQMKNPNFLHNVGSFITYTGFLYHFGLLQNKDNGNYQQKYYIFSCNGAGFLIRKETARLCGLFDEDFFYFYDDSDLSHRVWLAGYTVVYCPRANLWHLWSATMKGANPQIWYYNHRNHISSFLRNLSAPYLFLMLFNFNLMLLLWFFVNIIKLRFNIAATLPKAYLWHLVHIKNTLEKRKLIQSKIRKVSDDEIFKKCLVNPNWKYYFIHFNFKYEDGKLPQRVLYV
ncbi:MAG: glycosyltransferase family 2 protein [Patescibacteria group bacterium]